MRIPVASCGALLLIATASTAQAPTEGCPRAHCDAANSDAANLSIPVAAGTDVVDVVWVRADTTYPGEFQGAGVGLGCSSNGTVAACSFVSTNDDDNVIVYDFDGTRTYESNLDYNFTVVTGAPLFLSSGATPEFVAADDEFARRYNMSTDTEVFALDHKSGKVLSSVLTANDTLILAGTGPYVTAIDNGAGPSATVLDEDRFEDDTGDIDEFHATNNTPAISTNRVFITQQHFDVNGLDEAARMIALDIDPDAVNAEDVITEAWSSPYTFFANPPAANGSKSSPLLMDGLVIFDGYEKVGGNYEARIFAVNQSDGSWAWTQTLTTSHTFASFAADPDGTTFWHLLAGTGIVTRRYVSNGNVVVGSGFTLGTLIDSDPSTTHIASSAMTISDDGAGADVMLIGAYETTVGAEAWVLAVNIDTQALVWKVRMPTSTTIGLSIPKGQFPIVSDGTDTRVIVAGDGPGVRAIAVTSP